MSLSHLTYAASREINQANFSQNDMQATTKQENECGATHTGPKLRNSFFKKLGFISETQFMISDNQFSKTKIG